MNESKAEKILSLLAELYAAQNNAKIKYHIEKGTIQDPKKEVCA